MKKLSIITSVVACIALSCIIVGCGAGCTATEQLVKQPDGTTVTNTVTTLDPVRTGLVIKAIVPPAVRLAIAQKPEVRPYILDAKVAICLLSSSTNVSPTDLKAVVAQTGLSGAQTPEVQATIESVYGIYTALWGDALNQKLSADARLAVMVPVLQSICEALGQGLATQ